MRTTKDLEAERRRRSPVTTAVLGRSLVLLALLFATVGAMVGFAAGPPAHRGGRCLDAALRLRLRRGHGARQPADGLRAPHPRLLA